MTGLLQSSMHIVHFKLSSKMVAFAISELPLTSSFFGPPAEETAFIIAVGVNCTMAANNKGLVSPG